jgi:hypothetical protein
MIFFSILLFNLSNSVWAEFPYETLTDQFTNTDSKSFHELSNLPPIKSQDGIGLCYGFAATTILEYYRCRELVLSCKQSENALSTLDVSSYNSTNKALKEGGDSYAILDHLKKSNRKIAAESCVPFSSLVHQFSSNNKSNEKYGWNILVETWKKFKKLQSENYNSNNLISCSNNIKANITNLDTNEDQINNALKTANSLESFLYQVLLPKKCLDDQIKLEIPPFETNRYPLSSIDFDKKKIAEKIEQVLLNDIPLVLNICGDPAIDNKCPENSGHALTLTGIKESCDANNSNCKTFVKVNNSYGNTWQLNNNNGWVDLESLLNTSEVFQKFNVISWINKPGAQLKNLKLNRNIYATNLSTPTIYPPAINRNSAIPEQWKNYKGIWKCPENKFVDRYEPGCVPMKFN